MSDFFKYLLVTFFLVQVAQAVYPMSASNSQSLAHLFLRSRLANQDPAASMACFANYILKSNDISESYGSDYNQCLVEAKAGRKDIESDMAGKRIDIAESSQNVCKLLSACNGLNTTLDIFNCHASIGANNTKVVYSISGNASEYASIMQENYRNIDLHHEQCCKLAERIYIEDTAVNYRTLQDCLEGRVKPVTRTTTLAAITSISTKPSPTSTTTITTTTTSAPSTTPNSPITSSTTFEQPASSQSPIVENPPDVVSANFPADAE